MERKTKKNPGETEEIGQRKKLGKGKRGGMQKTWLIK